MTTANIDAIKAVILSRDKNRLIELATLVRNAENSADLIARLDFTDEQMHALATDADWTALVYEQFASAFGNGETIDDHEDDEHLSDLGTSFLKELLPGLPRELEKFLKLMQVPKCDPTLFNELRSEADVDAASEIGLFLAQRGLRPVVFHLAMNGLATLVDDLRQDGDLPSAGPVRVFLDANSHPPADGIDLREAAMEIALSASLDLPENEEEEKRHGKLDDVPLPLSGWVLIWLIDASRTKPLLFPGYFADFEGNDVMKLTPIRQTPSRSERWTTIRDGVPVVPAPVKSAPSPKRHAKQPLNYDI